MLKLWKQLCWLSLHIDWDSTAVTLCTKFCCVHLFSSLTQLRPENDRNNIRPLRFTSHFQLYDNCISHHHHLPCYPITENTRHLLELLIQSYIYCTVHHLDSWIKRDQLDVTCFLFNYLMLNMFRMLIHPPSGACDLFVELFHGLYCSGSMCVGVTVWYVLTSETCWALNNEIKKQVSSSWSLFIQLS